MVDQGKKPKQKSRSKEVKAKKSKQRRQIGSNLVEVLGCWMLSFAVMSDTVGKKKLSGRGYVGFIYDSMPTMLHFVEKP